MEFPICRACVIAIDVVDFDRDFVTPFLLALALVVVVGFQTSGFSNGDARKGAFSWPKARKVQWIRRERVVVDDDDDDHDKKKDQWENVSAVKALLQVVIVHASCSSYKRQSDHRASCEKSNVPFTRFIYNYWCLLGPWPCMQDRGKIIRRGLILRTGASSQRPPSIAIVPLDLALCLLLMSNKQYAKNTN